MVQDESRKNTIEGLEKLMEETCENRFSKTSNSFYIGEIVAVRVQKKLCRAIIELVQIKERDSSNVYSCWLIDYGFMTETNTVFKVSPIIRKTPALALQASLYNVTYCGQRLNFNNSGEGEMVDYPVKTPTSISHQIMLEILSTSETLQFKLEYKEDGIIFGDILYEDKHNQNRSLKDSLIEERVLQVNEVLFEEILESINDYKERNMTKIAQFCKSNQDILIRMTKSDDIGIKCDELAKKYLVEFEYDDELGLDRDEFSRRPFSPRNKSINNTCSSLDLTTTSESDSSKPKESLSKRKRLLQTMVSYRNAKLESLECSHLSQPTDEANKENESVSPEGNSPGTRNRLKKLLEQMKKKKEQLKEEKQQPKEEKETLPETPKAKPTGTAKIQFFPAGSERTYFHSNIGKKERKKSSGGYSSTQYSSEDSSAYNNFHHKRKLPSQSFHQPAENCKNLKKLPENHVVETSSLTVDNEIQGNTNGEVSKEDSFEISETEEETSVSTEPKPLEAQGNGDRVTTLNIKPHCNCKQCDHWTNEQDNWKNSYKAKVAKIVEGNKQVLFKEANDSRNQVNILSLEYSSMSKMEKQAMTKLLVHSESIPNPVHLISKVSFHREIHQNLFNLDYRETKKIQSYSWPALFRNQHVCMVHGPQTGKTMAYLPVMCTFILEKADRYESLLKISGGPIVIILGSNTKKCEEIYDLAKILLGKSRARVHLITYPLGHVNTSHIDLLVTTPPILDELIKSKAVNFKRLCHLILEDGDRILNHHHALTGKLLDLAQSVLKHRVCSRAVQLIVCSEHWTSRISNLLKRLQQVPVVCIGNHLEATLYGKMEFSMRFRNSANKEGELKALLKETYSICRSIIVCKEDEIEDVETILMLKGIDSVSISKDMKKEDIYHLEETWSRAKGGQYKVLVCSDFILNTMLSVTSASLLIHYSLPTSWSKFVKRFSCLLENCKSPLDSKEVRMVSHSVVLCDETCEGELPKFFSYINSTELKSQLPDKLQEYSRVLTQVEEEKKLEKAIGFCDNLKLFGKCTKTRCPSRHIIGEALDISNHLPKCGRIQFKIVNVQDVTCFSIVLLQHIDGDGKVSENDELQDITGDLSATLGIRRKKINQPIVGHQYAFYDLDEREGVYLRCELLEVDNDCVKIKLFDKGAIISTMITRIYHLPKEFNDHNKPRSVIDAYLANYIPPYQDENFSAKSFFNLKHLLEKHDYKNVIFTADVHLQLSNALWLKNVCEEITLSDRVIPGFQLSREILIKKLVAQHNDQLHNLYKLCIDAGITLPTYEKKRISPIEVEEKIIPRWAFLDADQPEEIIFSAAISPDEIYVRLNKFSNLLYTMQKDIQKVIQKPYYPKVCEVKIGDVYLAKDPEVLEYSRVLVLNKDEEEALVFFVDFGNEAVVPASDLKYIQKEYITRLPFQSIQCKLHGIEPISKEWDGDITNTLYDYATEPYTDIFRSLYVKVCHKETSHILGQRKYSVLLKDGFGEKNSLINQLFIDCGLAVPNSEVIEDFEIPVSKSDASDESHGEEDEVMEIRKSMKEVDGEERIDVQEDEFELFFNETDVDAEKKFFDLIIYGRREEQPKMLNRELPPITAAPPTDYSTPDIYWSQSESSIRISIKLTDVVDYKLTLTKARILNFRTVKNEKTYCVKLVLYETVDTMQHTSPGPDIRITLTKTKEIDWPRLILAKQRIRYIHYDLTTLKVEENKKKFLELPEELKEEDSDDDVIDMMYTIGSDLDSDLDVELPHDSD
ncbi:hypothetical protein JTB14_000421 [Gonioctena quinquepunctata]|nr:hypothetical protein JTB14_000421 [Gonioctena quinquepunctata]